MQKKNPGFDKDKTDVMFGLCPGLTPTPKQENRFHWMLLR